MFPTTTSQQYPKLGKDLREAEFGHLDQDVAFCNSGSWSCVPKKLIGRQFELIKLRESNPRWYSAVIAKPLYKDSMDAISEMVGAKPENLTLIENATTGSNTVLKLQNYSPGDKILMVNIHTYPAVVKQIKSVLKSNPGVETVVIDIPFPIQSKDDILKPYAKALKELPDIKMTVVDHITSLTAVVMPLKEIIDMCHQHGVIVLVDGAHTPGHINLTVEDYGADFYVGNLSKWMMTPRGVGFLWVHPRHQAFTSPLVTSHAEDSDNFIDRFYSPMTRDMIPHVLVKDAVNFHKDLGGLEKISDRNSDIVTEASKMLSDAWKTPVLEVEQELRAPFMAVVGLPIELNDFYKHDKSGWRQLSLDLLGRGTDIKCFFINGRFWCRISCNVWNDREDYYRVRDDVLQLLQGKRVLQETTGT